VAADKTDQPGVLGNLPRSRPGQRSDKRRGAVRAAAAATAADAAKASGRKPAAARAKPAAARPKPAPKPRARKPEPQAAPAQTSSDPLTTAVRAAGKVAEVGLKTAGSLLRRLPVR
jgi:hypothetical protein